MDRFSSEIEFVRSMLDECEGYEDDQRAWALERGSRARGIDPGPVYVELIRCGETGYVYPLRLLGSDAVVAALPSLLDRSCRLPAFLLRDLFDDVNPCWIPALAAALLGNCDDDLRMRAARALADMGPAAAAAVPNLIAVVREPDAYWPLVESAANALVRIGPHSPEVVAVLHEAAGREDLNSDDYNPVNEALEELQAIADAATGENRPPEPPVA